MIEIPPGMAMVPLILGKSIDGLEELAKGIEDLQEASELNRTITELSSIKARYENHNTRMWKYGKYADPARYLQ